MTESLNNLLDQTLDDFYENILDVQDTAINFAQYDHEKKLVFEQTKASLIDYIEDIIGEDDVDMTRIDGGLIVDEETPIRNTLRAEQRAKLKELKGE
jgi:hypothetical protein